MKDPQHALTLNNVDVGGSVWLLLLYLGVLCTQNKAQPKVVVVHLASRVSH